MLVSVRFIRHFRVAGGPLYVSGDVAALGAGMAEEAIRQGAALRVQDANYGEALSGPPSHKMILTPPRQKG